MKSNINIVELLNHVLYALSIFENHPERYNLHDMPEYGLCALGVNFLHRNRYGNTWTAPEYDAYIACINKYAPVNYYTTRPMVYHWWDKKDLPSRIQFIKSVIFQIKNNE